MRYEWKNEEMSTPIGEFRRLHNTVTAVKRVLLVEDDEHLAMALTERLRSVGFEVMTAGDGMSALQLLRLVDHDALVLDLGLPRMHGLKVLHDMRMDGDIEEIPVVVLTGSSDQTIEHAEGYGVFEIHKKPTRLARVAASVRDAVAFQ